jgi:hypothetical protein
MLAAAAFLVMHGIMAVDDSDFAAMLQLQRAQALLIGRCARRGPCRRILSVRSGGMKEATMRK